MLSGEIALRNNHYYYNYYYEGMRDCLIDNIVIKLHLELDILSVNMKYDLCKNASIK